MVLSIIAIVGVIVISGYFIWDLTISGTKDIPICFGEVPHNRCSNCKYREECLEEYLWK